MLSSGRVFEAGTLLAGKYRVEHVLGRGGMGVVVAALHIHLNQRVALKFLLPEMLQNQGVVERFVREARASAQLRGEHVCRVSDVGTLDSGAPYIVMELLEGRDLSTMITHNGPMPVATAVDYVLQACLGVGEAHSLGVVHRDLKPANLFLTQRPDGTPLIKVLDFGIAKAQADANFNLTKTSSVLGSPGYMSPEQLRSTRDCDARSDIWAIGIILSELVSGRQPFIGESITELALHIVMDPTPPVMSVQLPPGFEQVIQGCLAKDPAHRFPDLAKLASALAPYGGPTAAAVATGVARVLNVSPSVPGMQSPLPATIMATTGFPPTTLGAAAGTAHLPPARSGPRWGIVAAVVAVLAIGGVAVGVAMSGKTADIAAAGGPPPAPIDAAASVAIKPPTPPPAIDAAPPPPIDAAPAVDAPIAPIAIDAAPATKPKPHTTTTTKPTKPTEDLGNDRF